MPLTIELDEDVAAALHRRAETLGLPFEFLANKLLLLLLPPRAGGLTPPVIRGGKNRASVPTISLQEGWHSIEITEGVELGKPGIYEWEVEGCGSYIGKYTRSSRPIKEYARNITNLLNGKNYRLGKPNRFRRIHRELGAAYLSGRSITLRIIENGVGPDLNRRERELISERGTLNNPISSLQK